MITALIYIAVIFACFKLLAIGVGLFVALLVELRIIR